MDLIIVESPSKAKTISRYLKGKYQVDASGGHIRDLPPKQLGVAVDNNYEPRYVNSPGKEAIIKRLSEESKKADKVYLATDPDREGEAISWHLQTVLGLDTQGKNRIEFNEISPKAVEAALEHPRTIDYAKKFSPFKAALEKYKGKKCKIGNKEQADAALSALAAGRYAVAAVKKSVAKSHAPAPFTTSTLQQDASNKLGMTAPETMLMAQHLYEGIDVEGLGHVAFVTYIRTDSTRVSSDAQAAARQYIEANYGKEYLPAKPNFYASKKGAQDAHEAIRPIDLARTPESVKKLLDRKHYNVYKLIYERFIASQMTEALYDAMQIEIANGDYSLKASGRALRFAGYTAVWQESKPAGAGEEEETKGLLPPLAEGDPLACLSVKPEQKFTKPPVRYTDASLVKTMEDKGLPVRLRLLSSLA